jgi:hypothetical protein
MPLVQTDFFSALLDVSPVLLCYCMTLHDLIIDSLNLTLPCIFNHNSLFRVRNLLVSTNLYLFLTPKKHDKQDQQEKAAFDKRNPHPTQ